MLKRGLATVYEAKSGVEFGGEGFEKRYRDVEAIAKKRGVGLWVSYNEKKVRRKVGSNKGRWWWWWFWWFWGGRGGGKGKGEWMSPREFKEQYR